MLWEQNNFPSYWLIRHQVLKGKQDASKIQPQDATISSAEEAVPAAQRKRCTHLALALVGSGVGGHEADFIVGLDLALLHTAGEHITHTLDLVDSGDRHAQRLVVVTLWELNHL